MAVSLMMRLHVVRLEQGLRRPTGGPDELVDICLNQISNYLEFELARKMPSQT
jgi:hypothetical protein